MRRFARVVLGGTFDRLHVGHEALLTVAFRAGRTVAIGLTTERFLAEHPKPAAGRIQAYEVRRRALGRWLIARYPHSRWTVVPLENRFGGSVEAGVDALIVSADTLGGARAVNAERRRRGFPPIPTLIVPLVLADDLRPMSSRRIRSGEIDRIGRRRTPIDVALALEDAADDPPARRGIRAAFPRARVLRVPFPDAPRAGRRSPSTLARRSVPRAELAIAVGRKGPTRRWVVERTASASLEPRVVLRRSPAAFSLALARRLAPSSAAKRFSPRRR